jgi:hypothetical protein
VCSPAGSHFSKTVRSMQGDARHDDHHHHHASATATHAMCLAWRVLVMTFCPLACARNLHYRCINVCLAVCASSPADDDELHG